MVLNVLYTNFNKDIKNFYLISENKKYSCALYYHVNNMTLTSSISFNCHEKNAIKYENNIYEEEYVNGDKSGHNV